MTTAVNAGRSVRLALLLVCAIPTVGAAQAQAVPPGNAWSQGTTIEAFGGVATADSRSGALAGGAAGWEITPRLGLEGSVAWFDRSGGSEAFAAAVTAHANLLGPAIVVPFVKGGVGMYRATFGQERDDIPDFYRRRLGPGAPSPGRYHTFTDPSLVVGGGVNLFTTRHWVISPEIESIILRQQSRTHVVTSVTAHVAYHFEEHPRGLPPGRQ
jgi:hypothetical protein